MSRRDRDWSLDGPLPGWMDGAECATDEARGLPWTTDTAVLPTVIVDLMRDTCDGCAVRSACNSYVLTEGVSGGMWAGSDRAPEPADIFDILDLFDRVNNKPVPLTRPLDPPVALGGAA